jgi:hypothetical protein
MREQCYPYVIESVAAPPFVEVGLFYPVRDGLRRWWELREARWRAACADELDHALPELRRVWAGSGDFFGIGHSIHRVSTKPGNFKRELSEYQLRRGSTTNGGLRGTSASQPWNVDRLTPSISAAFRIDAVAATVWIQSIKLRYEAG